MGRFQGSIWIWRGQKEHLYFHWLLSEGLPWWFNGKESACWCRRHEFDTWSRKIPWGRKWQPTPVFLPGKIPWTEEPGRVQSTGLQKSWTRYTTEEQLSKNLACPAIRDVGNKPQECQQHRDCHQQKSPVFSFSRYTCCRDQELPFVVMATSKSTLLLHFVR